MNFRNLRSLKNDTKNRMEKKYGKISEFLIEELTESFIIFQYKLVGGLVWKRCRVKL